MLCVLPFHYSFGNSLLLTHVAVGGRVVVDNRFAYPSSVVETLERSRVSGFSGVPSTYAILAATPTSCAAACPTCATSPRPAAA